MPQNKGKTLNDQVIIQFEYHVLRSHLEWLAAPEKVRQVPEAVQRIRDFAPTLTDAALLMEILHVAVNLADATAQSPPTPGPADTSA